MGSSFSQSKNLATSSLLFSPRTFCLASAFTKPRRTCPQLRMHDSVTTGSVVIVGRIAVREQRAAVFAQIGDVA